MREILVRLGQHYQISALQDRLSSSSLIDSCSLSISVKRDLGRQRPGVVRCGFRLSRSWPRPRTPGVDGDGVARRVAGRRGPERSMGRSSHTLDTEGEVGGGWHALKHAGQTGTT